MMMPPNIKKIMRKGSEAGHIDPLILESSMNPNCPGRVTFYNMPRNEGNRFYFYVEREDIYEMVDFLLECAEGSHLAP